MHSSGLFNGSSEMKGDGDLATPRAARAELGRLDLPFGFGGASSTAL